MSTFNSEISPSVFERPEGLPSRRDILTRASTLMAAVALPLIGGCGARAVIATPTTMKEGNSPMSTIIAEDFRPAPVIPLPSQPPARLIVDSPLPEALARGYVVVRYRTENLRILPVYGPAALEVSPRIGHLHITVDDLPWHWLDASGEPLSINGLPPGPHKLLIELESPIHKVIDSATVSFEIPQRPAPHS
jgi:Family of unknown function (DUF6130)